MSRLFIFLLVTCALVCPWSPFSSAHAGAAPLLLTDGRSDVLRVAFDKSGQYLYFTSSTDVALTTGWMDGTSLQRSVTRSVYAILLKRGTPLPFTAARVQGRDDEPVRVDIDLEGIAQRTVPLPIAARNYYDLLAGKPGMLFLVAGPPVDPPARIP